VKAFLAAFREQRAAVTKHRLDFFSRRHFFKARLSRGARSALNARMRTDRRIALVYLAACRSRHYKTAIALYLFSILPR